MIVSQSLHVFFLVNFALRSYKIDFFLRSTPRQQHNAQDRTTQDNNTRQDCQDITRQDCQDITRQDCQDITRQGCQDITRQDCLTCLVLCCCIAFELCVLCCVVLSRLVWAICTRSVSERQPIFQWRTFTILFCLRPDAGWNYFIFR